MKLDQEVLRLVKSLQDKTIARRRDLHRHPESGWTEFRTASIVADTLTELGYQVSTGDEVLVPEAMMGVPVADELARQAERALSQGANPHWVEKMKNGKTGVVGIMTFDKSGPTVALRFDMDANDAVETENDQHRPYREHFSSVNRGAMHACGHDGHTAVGLAVAEILVLLRDKLSGTIKLIFQPAEEGVRGAKAMALKGIVDDADYFLGMHFGFKMQKTGQFCCNIHGFLATTKYDAIFKGIPAHAGAAPETGRNALLAAATAALNLHAISRHSQGASRINVGVLNAGSGRNVIPAKAVLKLETRGVTSDINQYMSGEAVRVIKSAAAMYGVEVAITEMGGAAGCSNSPLLVGRLGSLAKRMGIFNDIVEQCDFGASEDCTYFMERVQERGGQAAYVMVGTDLAAGHHDSSFDFDEKALTLAVTASSGAAVELLTSDEKS